MRFAVAVIVGLLAVGSLYFTIALVESGNVGVRKTLGKVNPEEATPGVNFKLPAVTQITEFVGKEIAIDLTDLTPKAADNLSLRDMDVSVFYKADSGQIADLYVKYAQGLAAQDRDLNPRKGGTGRKRIGIGIYYFEEDMEKGGESS